MNTGLEISPELIERIDKAYFAWFTTVRTDGMPQPTPVWFIRDVDGTFLIYSPPDARKVQNLRSNPHVALSFAYDEKAERYIVVMGEARIDENALPIHLNVEYLAKYGEGITGFLNFYARTHLRGIFGTDSHYTDTSTGRLSPTMTAVRVNQIAGIAYHQGRVLLHRSENDDFWSLPGGAIEMMERAESALIREMREEMNAEVVPGKLLMVVENFFSYTGATYHETGLYLAMTFPPESPILQQESSFDGMEHFFGDAPLRLIFEWTPLAHLSEKMIKPDFLNQALLTLETMLYPLHLIQDDAGLSR